VRHAVEDKSVVPILFVGAKQNHGPLEIGVLEDFVSGHQEGPRLQPRQGFFGREAHREGKINQEPATDPHLQAG